MLPKKVFLTFDLEEFDIPLEFGSKIDFNTQINISSTGLDNLLPVLKKYNVESTFFTTANYASQKHQQVKLLAEKHEIASHTYFHSQFSNEHLIESKQVLENITGKKVEGLRMPRMQQVDLKEVQHAGYTYDSSINPTRLPGRYDFTHLPRTAFTDDKLLRIPASVSPKFRIPLFWLAFKNLPYFIFKRIALQTLEHDGYLNLYFHPWEFADISAFKLPLYVKRVNGNELVSKLDKLLKDLSSVAVFDSLKNYKKTSA